MNTHNRPYRIDSKGNKVELTNVVAIGYLANDSIRAIAKLEGKVVAAPKLSAKSIRGVRVY